MARSTACIGSIFHNNFQIYSSFRTNATREENLAEIINDSIGYGILKSLIALFYFLTGIVAIDSFNYTALKQITRIRIRFFESLIRQDIAWHDVSNDNNFAVRITE